MSRPLRVDIPGGWYHITMRGHNRQTIFLDDKDREHFLELLGALVEMHGVEVHGYVIMDNHYHLIIRTPDANASRGMQWLNVSYGVWWNRRHEKSGSVFEGRFKGIVVEGGEWLLKLSYYVHFNPVATQRYGYGKREKRAEAQGVKIPDKERVMARLEKMREYRWSSYRTYAGFGRGQEWLRTEAILSRCEGGRDGYREGAERRLRSGCEDSIWSGLKYGIVLGRAKFAEKLRETIKVERETALRNTLRQRVGLEQIVEVIENLKGEQWKDFLDRRGDCGRDVFLWAARRFGGYALKELADKVGGVDYTAITQSIRRLEARAQHDKAIASMMEKVKQCINSMSFVKT